MERQTAEAYLVLNVRLGEMKKSFSIAPKLSISRIESRRPKSDARGLAYRPK